MVASLSSVVAGSLSGLSSTLTYSVVHGTEGISATLEEASWISKWQWNNNLINTSSFLLKGTLPSMGFIFGSLAGGIMSATVGRINTLFLCGLPTIGCFIMIGFANNLWYIYLAMFFGGLSNSATFAIVGELYVMFHQLFTKWNWSHLGIYISETCHKSMRNRLGTIQSLFTSSGAFLGYAMGYFIGWRNLCFMLSLVASLAAFLPLFTLYETPYWLYLKERREDAE